MTSGIESAPIDPQIFIDMYGPNAVVLVGEGPVTTLGQALMIEKMFCPAEDANRLDPYKRVGFLASILAAGGSLRPEHIGLLPARME